MRVILLPSPLNRGAGNLTSMAMLGQCQCYCPAMPGNVSGAGSREQGGSNNISCSLGAWCPRCLLSTGWISTLYTAATHCTDCTLTSVATDYWLWEGESAKFLQNYKLLLLQNLWTVLSIWSHAHCTRVQWSWRASAAWPAASAACWWPGTRRRSARRWSSSNRSVNSNMEMDIFTLYVRLAWPGWMAGGAAG